MASFKIIHNLSVLAVLALVCIIVTAHASPIATTDQEPSTNMREGRFYGMGGAQASAVANANAGAGGFGYPYGGYGLAGSSAIAQANAGAFGYGK